jgi:hypothetical protein
MKGTDVLVARAAGPSGGAWAAEDRFSEDFVEPGLDAQQDVRLVSAQVSMKTE